MEMKTEDFISVTVGSCHLPELRIVLLGAQWSGKSSAGNTILGREEFEPGIRTAQCVRRQGEVAGRQVTVVDTPGWRYIPVKDTPELVKQEIMHSVSLCPPGPCAFLLVIHMGGFTELHRRLVEEHLKLLSERVWSHTIVLFTRGDSLGRAITEKDIEAAGSALRWVVEKCGNRYHVLNDKNRGDVTQVTELLEKIEEMVAGLGGCHYEMEKQSLPTGICRSPINHLQKKDFESHQQFFHYPPAEFHEIPIKPPLTKMQGVSPPPALPKFPLSMAPHELNPGRETPHAAHLSATHVGSKKRQCGSCETVASDIAHWTLLEPSTYGENGILSYSFICPPGRYECQESGLRWVCVVGVSLQYHYCSWENFEEQRNSLNCTIGGPLLDITVTAGHLDEIHLPHFICLGPDPSLSDRVKVLHVTDSGVSLERKCEVSRFHVKILQPTFSPMGVVVQLLKQVQQNLNKIFRTGINKESHCRAHCRLLVFHGCKKAHLTLHIYLIPNNPALKKCVEEEEQKNGSVIIHKPPEPKKSLLLGKKYRLRHILTSCTIDINPEEVELNDRDSPSNFFEVFVEQAESVPQISIELVDEDEIVWTTCVRKGDYSGSKDSVAGQSVPSFKDAAVRFVDDHREALTQRVSLVKPIADALIQKSLISSEAYSRICTEKTSQEQMRMLYQFLDSGGPKVKFFFYTVLLRMDYPLVEDLGGV